jgi:hypothetical protein
MYYFATNTISLWKIDSIEKEEEEEDVLYRTTDFTRIVTSMTRNMTHSRTMYREFDKYQ